MAHLDDPSNHKVDFHWGKKRGVGGKTREIQFYESFVFDNINYSLYDCVYLYKASEAEPYIGKLVKIWELPGHKKRVKILWFFRPSEMEKYLGDHVPLENEIFLACGEGVGLSNINPLEAIAGKCTVICASKDERNREPSSGELELADYIFYRTFNVKSYSISENFENKIDGIEVKFLFNKEVTESSALLGFQPKDSDAKSQKAVSSVSYTPAKSIPERISDNKVDNKASNLPNSSEKVNLIEENHVKRGEFVNGLPSKGALGKDRHSENQVGDDDRPSKKIKLEDGVQPSNLQNTISSNLSKGASHEGSREKIHIADKESSDKVQLGARKTEAVEKTQQKISPASTENIKNAGDNILVVTRRPDADRSKWFKGIPWEDKLQKADNQGTLVFFGNLDPSYTSSEVEDIIYHALELSCTAKVIPQTTYQNPNYGQAYVIFKTREAADLAVSKINSRCLLQPNKRPIMCSKGMLKVPKSAMNGHLSINRLKLHMPDMKRAVSTSHSSQPNTIEYEMSMDWVLSQEKFYRALRKLHKEQIDEVRQTKEHLKIK